MTKCSYCNTEAADILKSPQPGSTAAICERCTRDVLGWFEAWRKERIESTYQASKPDDAQLNEALKRGALKQ